MKVRDLLETKGKDTVSIDVNSTVDDAIRSMHARKISAIIVVENGKTVGIFTERDVVRSYIASNGKSFKVIGMLSIRDIIQTQVTKLTSEIHYLKDYITGF